jgi:hypothetical protein
VVPAAIARVRFGRISLAEQLTFPIQFDHELPARGGRLARLCRAGPAAKVDAHAVAGQGESMKRQVHFNADNWMAAASS